jgi:hypothetical protein
MEDDPAAPSAFEQERQARIKRNREMLAMLQVELQQIDSSLLLLLSTDPQLVAAPAGAGGCRTAGRGLESPAGGGAAAEKGTF